MSARFGFYPIDDHVMNIAVGIKRILNANLKVSFQVWLVTHKGATTSPLIKLVLTFSPK
ncbi:MAG: hypothetical protein ACI9RO_001676 [Alteromonas macleodii]